jgi:hypothetical protein
LNNSREYYNHATFYLFVYATSSKAGNVLWFREQVPEIYPMDYTNGYFKDMDLQEECATQEWMDKEYGSLATDIKGWKEWNCDGVASKDAGNA